MPELTDKELFVRFIKQAGLTVLSHEEGEGRNTVIVTVTKAISGDGSNLVSQEYIFNKAGKMTLFETRIYKR